MILRLPSVAYYPSKDVATYLSRASTLRGGVHNAHTGSAVRLGLVLARPLFELHLAEIHDSRCRLVQTRLLFVAEAEHDERFLHRHTHARVVAARHR